MIMGFVLKSWKIVRDLVIDLVTMELAAYLAITLFLVQSVKDAFSSSDTLFSILTSRSAHLLCEQGTLIIQLGVYMRVC